MHSIVTKQRPTAPSAAVPTFGIRAKESLLIMASPENPLLEVRKEINYGKK
ncbi:hypothetical protein [Blautia massiliensis (ex Durand et al. 2017)]|uniref:hypothetical protein n=1 Tax=Blautia massiliensis (ex Durand et al. 2017) TaxID=1737424 RepID=UPI0039A07758